MNVHKSSQIFTLTSNLSGGTVLNRHLVPVGSLFKILGNRTWSQLSPKTSMFLPDRNLAEMWSTACFLGFYGTLCFGLLFFFFTRYHIFQVFPLCECCTPICRWVRARMDTWTLLVCTAFQFILCTINLNKTCWRSLREETYFISHSSVSWYASDLKDISDLYRLYMYQAHPTYCLTWPV